MSVRILVIGAGFSGVCLGIALKRARIDSFTLLEKADRVGGTWRDNTYPGCACDSPAFQYCFSFEQKTDWSRKWVPHDEIQRYLEHCVQKYDLAPHIRFSTEVERADWDAAAGLWHVHTSSGERFVAEVLVSGVGQLHRPHMPKIPGLAAFAGAAFHSAQWNHDAELRHRRVAVVGTAASAVQLVPQIAMDAARVTIFQRSANWMLPRGDRAFTAVEHARFAAHPVWSRLYRWWQWWRHELRFPVFGGRRRLAQVLERISTAHMRRIVQDPVLQELLIPDYPIGGKRILISDDYYETLNRPNVEVVTDAIERIEPATVVTRGGRRIDADAIVFATGFETTAFLAPMQVVGASGVSLAERWCEGAHAYLGMAVPGFPNFFLMYGPNTNLGHNSIVFMIECQTRYIMDCIRALRERDLKSISVRADVERAFVERAQQRLARSAWAATRTSWYKTASGRITNNWPGTTIEYWWRTRHADLSCYDVETRTESRPDASVFEDMARFATGL